jgi:DNA-binding response OmpR family regulator
MLKNVNLVFGGDPTRGKRIQKAVREQGWRIHIEAVPERAIIHCLQYEPDLVIIDDCPGSAEIISVFYRLRAEGKGPFLFLNDSPGDIRFSRLSALSFLRIIERDPEPADLINTVISLIESNHESRSRQVAPSTPLKSVWTACIRPALLGVEAKDICC